MASSCVDEREKGKPAELSSADQFVIRISIQFIDFVNRYIVSINGFQEA